MYAGGTVQSGSILRGDRPYSYTCFSFSLKTFEKAKKCKNKGVFMFQILCLCVCVYDCSCATCPNRANTDPGLCSIGRDEERFLGGLLQLGVVLVLIVVNWNF